MKLAAALLALCPLVCFAQQRGDSLREQEIQRAIIQLDQRSADFASGRQSPPLDPTVGRVLQSDPDIARQMRPYERMRAAEARETGVLQLPPPAVRNEVRNEARKLDKPSPLPGGPRGALEPNAITSPRNPD
jgi:hypothetical protein